MTKQQQKENLMPSGVPRWVRCYDNRGETFDRYTVVFTHSQSFYSRGYVPILAMSANPYHPQGFGQHGEYRIGELCEGMKPGQWPPAIGKKGNLGVRIRFEDLPADCRRAVVDDYKSYWNIK